MSDPVLAIVEWRDACEVGRRGDYDPKKPLATARSVGWVARGPGCIVVVATMFQDDYRANDGPVLSIPVKWIKRMTRLETGKRLRVGDL